MGFLDFLVVVFSLYVCVYGVFYWAVVGGVIVFWVGGCWLLLWAGFFCGVVCFFKECMYEVTVDQRS